MAKLQFLTILLTVTCFLGGVVSITDKEFEVSTVQLYSGDFGEDAISDPPLRRNLHSMYGTELNNRASE